MKKFLINFKNNFYFSWKDVLKLKKIHPEYFDLNRHIARDEGAKLSKGSKIMEKSKKNDTRRQYAVFEKTRVFFA